MGFINFKKVFNFIKLRKIAKLFMSLIEEFNLFFKYFIKSLIKSLFIAGFNLIKIIS